jgi:hypothetical protein
VFEAAFDFIKEDPHVRMKLLAEKYVTFSEQLLLFYNKTEKGKAIGAINNFFNSPVLDEQGKFEYGGNVKMEKKSVPVQSQVH